MWCGPGPVLSLWVCVGCGWSACGNGVGVVGVWFGVLLVGVFPGGGVVGVLLGCCWWLCGGVRCRPVSAGVGLVWGGGGGVMDGMGVWFDCGVGGGYCFLRCAEGLRPGGSGLVVSCAGAFSFLVFMGSPCARVCVGVVCELDSVFVCLQFVLFCACFCF